MTTHEALDREEARLLHMLELARTAGRDAYSLIRGDFVIGMAKIDRKRLALLKSANA